MGRSYAGFASYCTNASYEFLLALYAGIDDLVHFTGRVIRRLVRDQALVYGLISIRNVGSGQWM